MIFPVGFGSSFQKLFPMSAPYNQDTLNRASQYAVQLKANLGGTEVLTLKCFCLIVSQILQPLKAILQQPANPKYPRQVIVLTGMIQNIISLIMLIRRRCGQSRCCDKIREKSCTYNTNFLLWDR